jgi:hypothetical protein
LSDPDRSSSPPDDASRLADKVAAEVADGRSDGRFPDGIDDELDSHWRRVVGRPPDVPLDRVHRAFDHYVEGATFHVPAVPAGSSMPGGAAVHKVVSKTVSRHLGDLVLQLDGFSRSVQEMFASIIAVLDDVPAHTHTQLVGQLESMEGRMAALMRSANAARDIDPAAAAEERSVEQPDN